MPRSWNQRPQICSADPPPFPHAPALQQFRSRFMLPSGECSKKEQISRRCCKCRDRECGSCRKSCKMQKSTEHAVCLGHAHTETARSPRQNAHSEYESRSSMLADRLLSAKLWEWNIRSTELPTVLWSASVHTWKSELLINWVALSSCVNWSGKLCVCIAEAALTQATCFHRKSNSFLIHSRSPM